MLKRITVFLTFATAWVMVGAVGSNPRYLEELVIGGGFGDTVDGGAWLEKDGDFATNGDILAEGDSALGKNEAVNHSLSVMTDSSNDALINLNEGNALNGGALWYDGSANKLFLGTRNGSSTITDAIEIAKGSANVKLLGNITLAGSTIAASSTLSLTSSDAPLKLAALNTSGSGDAYIYLFRDTNTTGYKQVLLYKGDGTSTVTAKWDAGTGNITSYGDGEIRGGDWDVGVDSTTRGVVTAWDGSGGSAPGCIKIASPNGTVWYLFVEDDGTVKVHSALPTSNSNGVVVGLQN